jgi:hypothetical protein
VEGRASKSQPPRASCSPGPRSPRQVAGNQFASGRLPVRRLPHRRTRQPQTSNPTGPDRQRIAARSSELRCPHERLAVVTQEIRTVDEGVRRVGARVQRRGGGHRPGTSRPGKRRLGRRVWQAWTSLSRRLDLARRHRGGRPSERTGHQVAVLARRGPQLSDLAAQHSAFWSLVAAKSASGYSREVVTPI